MNTEGLRERKKQKTRDLLIDIALQLFIEKGFEETTVEEISAAAEVSPRTFFRYFPTKEDVVFLDQEEENALMDKLIAERDPKQNKLDSLIEITGKLFDLSFQNFAHSPQIFTLVVKTPSLLARATEIVTFTTKKIADGFIDRSSSPEQIRHANMLAGAFIGGLFAAILRWVHDGMKEDPKTLLQELGALLQDGFHPREKK